MIIWKKTAEKSTEIKRFSTKKNYYFRYEAAYSIFIIHSKQKKFPIEDFVNILLIMLRFL